jgi:autotransporter-associated beta strand protein
MLGFAACALAAGIATPAMGQIQIAGNLQVSLDAVSLAVGPVSFLANSGTAAGVFQAVTNTGLGPQVIALGGNGTHGLLFDGEEFLVHMDIPGGVPLFAPVGMTGTAPIASVEAWVFAPTLIDDNPIVSWGTRGSCGAQASCAYGANGTWGGFAMWCNDHGWSGGTPAAGTWHYLAWTLNATEVKLYVDGGLNADYTGLGSNIDPNNNIAIGMSHGSTGGTTDGITAGAVIARVRIHDGVLTDAQVLNNYNFEKASFTNGTPAFLAAKPLHRWSFTHAATNDAVGLTVTDTGTTGTPANGVVQGIYGGATAQFSGTQLILAGGNSGSAPYVDLPNGLVSSLSTNNSGSGQVTFEAWVAPQGSHSWARVFDFGSNTLGEITGPGGSFSGLNYVTMVATPGGPADLNNAAWGYEDGNYWFKSRLTGALVHLAMEWDDINSLVTVYENGVQVASLHTTNRLASIVDVNNWLGRSNWSGDDNLQGGLAEFRIFNRLLSPAEVLNDFQVGPTVVDKVLKWNGNVNGTWDLNTTANWLNGTTSVKYNDGGTVQFDDSLSGTPNVNLTFAAQPATLTFNHSATNYMLTGSGRISGAVGLTKSGTGSLTLGGPGANDYTGQTVLNNGTLIVTNLANGGSPSAIGASSSSAANLSLAGGTLSYRGPATSINRGYLVTGNSTLDVQGDLTLSGLISASGGTFTKSGAAKLTYNGTGMNQLSAGGGGQAFAVGNGTVVIDGTAGQTNTVTGETWVGFDQAHGASLVLSNTVMTNSSWFAVGRGNGTGGLASSATLYNSLYRVGNCSLGYNNGIAGNNQTASVILSGNSQLINTGGTGAQVGESTGSTGNLVVSNSSWVYSANRILLGPALGATGIVVIANNGAITNGGWVSLGAPGSASVTLKDNAIWQALVDFNVTDTTATAGQPSGATLNIQDNALLRINTLYVAKNIYCTGTINQSGGTVLRNGGGDWRIGGNVPGGVNQLGTYNLSGGTMNAGAANFQVGAQGTGYFIQTGGTAISRGGWASIGRFAGAVGYLNVSGGTFIDDGISGNNLLIGEAGTGTLNVSGTGVVTVRNNLVLGNGNGTPGVGTANITNGLVVVTNSLVFGNLAGSSGTLNLYGGTLVASQVYMATAGSSSYINFYGGTLQAGPNANANFMSGLTSATVYNGAVINSDTNVLTIAQDLLDGGMGGGLTKLGSGSLTLSGNLSYAGPTHVAVGTLGSTTHDTSPGGIAVDDGAALTLQVLDALGSAIAPATLTIGNSTGAALTLNLGNFGNPTQAPLGVTGAVTANGTVTLNIDPTSTLSVGEVPLISYNTLSGGFVLGTLPPGVSGYLTNDTAHTPKFVGLVVTSVILPRWEGLAGGTWDVQVTTNWVDQVSLLPDFFFQGTRPVFDDRAQGTTSVNLVANVIPGGVLVSNNLLTYTISGVGRITGSGGLTKLGTNTLTLSTTNNTYSGSTLIDEGGTLISTVANNLGVNSALAISNVSTLSLGANNQKLGSVLLANGTIAASGATITAASYNLDNGAVGALLAGGPLSTFGASTDLVSVLGGNTYTGRTVLGGSTLVATSLANGGSASSIGSSSASPTNLLFAGGALRYTGPAASINRGYSVSSGGTLDVEGNLTLSGPITATAGNFTKSGAAQLTYTSAGINNLSMGGGGGAYAVGNGTVVVDGSAGQTNTINGELWVGFDQADGAALVLTNTVLTNSSWFAIGRGNGTLGLTSTATLNNSLLSCGNLSLGYWNGIAGNLQNVALTLSGNSKMINGGNFNLSESAGSSSTVTIQSNSWVSSGNRVLIGMATSATGAVVIANSGALTNGGWVSIGAPGVATATLRDNAIWQALTDFNVTDTTGDPANPSIGTLNIQDNAKLIINTLYVGKSGDCYGTINQSGGTVIRNAGGEWRMGGNLSGIANQFGTYNLSGGSVYGGPVNLQIGAYGQGEWAQTGGYVAVGGYPSIGRFPGGVGQMDISAGSFNNTNPATISIVGEQGNGTLNISGSGVFMSAGGVSVGHTTTGIGLLNLNGGVLNVSRVFQGNASASGTFNFNGGLLQALPGSYPGFMSGLTAVNVLASGAIIDSGANSITIGSALLDGGTGGGLTKLGSGALSLAAADTYTGPTVVSNGTLLVDGSLASVSVDVKSGATLGGNGTIAGAVLIEAGGTLNAGSGGLPLTVASPPTLNGTVLADLNWNGGSPIASELVVSSGTLAYSGTLVLANVGVPLAAGDTFTLFNAPAYSGSFTVVSQTPGQVVTWDTSRLTVDGTVKVASVISTVPINIGAVVVGGSLQLTWPADHLGWRLLVQTNHLSQGISLNHADWGTVPGSTTVTQETIPIDHTKPTEFYRLVYP